MSLEIFRLGIWQESADVLRGLVKQQDILIAHLEKVHLALPLSLENSLKPLIGQRIAILRTDLPQKGYILRILEEKSIYSKKTSEVG